MKELIARLRAAEANPSAVESWRDLVEEAADALEKMSGDAERYRYWRKHYRGAFVIQLPEASLKFDAKRPQAEAAGSDYEGKVDAAIDEARKGER